MGMRIRAFVAIAAWLATTAAAQVARTDPAATASVTWTRWWALNEERFLDLGARQRIVTVTPSDSFGAPTADTLASVDRRRVDAALRVLAIGSRDEHHSVRVAASRALGYLAAPQATGDLVRALGDDDLAVRESAVVALGLSDDPRAAEPLVALLDGSRKATLRVRALAALSLGLLGTADGLDALGAVATARDLPRDLRVSALIGTGLVRDEAARRVLERALDARWCGAAESAAIAIALGCQRDPAALKPLARLLRDRRASVRRAAALAIGTFPRNAALSRSLRAAREHLDDADDTEMGGRARKRLEDYIARERAALDKARTDEATRWARLRAGLRRVATKDADHGARAHALIALGQVGERVDANLLAGTLRRGRHDHRGFAAVALGIFARRHDALRADVVAELRRVARTERSVDVRGALLVARGLAHDRGAAVDAIADLGADREPSLRGYAAITLGLLGERRAARQVADALLDVRDPDAQRRIAYGLARIGGPREVARFRRALGTDTDVQTRVAAATGLAFLGGLDALSALERFLADEGQPALARAQVAEALGLANDRRGAAPLARITAGYDEALGFAAVDRIVAMTW